MAEIERRRLHVKGVVQGVGFRYFTLSAARRCGTIGWVRNEADGSVLCEAQGSSDALDRLESELQRGPNYSRVDSVKAEVLEVDAAESGFVIR